MKIKNKNWKKDYNEKNKENGIACNNALIFIDTALYRKYVTAT